jgi:hypothetical protein
MSVIFSGTNQGKFTQPATAANVLLNIRSGVDWIRSVNYTARTSSFWQLGMPNGGGLFTDINGTTSIIAVGNGFYPIDTSVNTPGAAVVFTSITNAAIPVLATGNTAGLAAGDIVRLYNVTGGVQLNSIDFTIATIIANTSFTLVYMSQVVLTAGGTFRKIPYNPIFYPRNRYISSISQAAQAVVVLTVTHGYLVGQVVSFIVPSVGGSVASYGMTEINGLQATIVAVNTTTNSITIDLDTTAFTAFAFPTTAQAAAGFTQAQVVPVGMDTAQGLNSGVDILSDATLNTGFLGMQLITGATSPGGVANDVVYWTSGNSFSISN